jgi:ubiquinone/menaquinone biosynthesis C-methylase UbiE
MAAQHADPFGAFKAAQREAWASFVPVEVITTIPAAKLVTFAQVAAGQRVLDVACGTGVVAVTAARRGASVSGLDLSPVLIERARYNADLAGVRVDFTDGDAEALPYPNASFDVVLSQFGHMFAPRPQVVLSEMLRVLKVGGRLAFRHGRPSTSPAACSRFWRTMRRLLTAPSRRPRRHCGATRTSCASVWARRCRSSHLRAPR